MITQKELKEILHYDPIIGIFTWKIKSAKNIKIGDRAGYLDKSHNYRKIKINGKRYPEHRLVFLYMIGLIPIQVDHDNHIRDDNRWINLNASTRKLNQKNLSKNKNNTSGYTGVCKGYKNTFVAEIKVNKKRIHLGSFTNLNDAINARKQAEILHGFHKNHGK